MLQTSGSDGETSAGHPKKEIGAFPGLSRLGGPSTEDLGGLVHEEAGLSLPFIRRSPWSRGGGPGGLGSFSLSSAGDISEGDPPPALAIAILVPVLEVLGGRSDPQGLTSREVALAPALDYILQGIPRSATATAPVPASMALAL